MSERAVTLQTFFDGRWHDAAEVEFHRPELGHRGATTFSYLLEYFAEHAAVDHSNGVRVDDTRAVSTALVSLEDRWNPTWPAFLMDLLPQGPARHLVAGTFGLNGALAASETELLRICAGAPVGNVRVKEAAARLRTLEPFDSRVRMDLGDVAGQTARFREVMEMLPALCPASVSLQGEWPKALLAVTRTGEVYPDPFVPDDFPADRYVAKFFRKKGERDEAILDVEGCYASALAAEGLAVHDVPVRLPGMLLVPRFDVTDSGGRKGQESLVSAIGVAEFGHQADHEAYVDLIARTSDRPEGDVAEYVARDLVNLSLGNEDNHGRNTALVRQGGATYLAPIFDLAPMRISGDAVARSTKWRCMREEGADYRPLWNAVAGAAAGGRYHEAVLSRVAEVASRLPAARARIMEETRFPEKAAHAMSRMDMLLETAHDALVSPRR